MDTKRKKLKTKKGEMPDYAIMISLSLLACFIVMLSSINFIGAIDKHLEIHRVARNYMLKIESHGYLSQDNATKLQENLENMGLSNINLSGTTMNKVNNGDDIQLDVHYDQTIKEIEINKFNIVLKNEVKHNEVELSSTAKN